MYVPPKEDCVDGGLFQCLLYKITTSMVLLASASMYSHQPNHK